MGRPAEQLLVRGLQGDARAVFWRLMLAQAVTGAVATALAWLLGGDVEVARSAAYGALVALLPTALAMSRGLRWAFGPVSALAGLILWELVKVALIAALLALASRVLGVVHWPALLLGLLLTLKVYWVAWLLGQTARKRHVKKTRKVLANGC